MVTALLVSAVLNLVLVVVISSVTGAVARVLIENDELKEKLNDCG